MKTTLYTGWVGGQEVRCMADSRDQAERHSGTDMRAMADQPETAQAAKDDCTGDGAEWIGVARD